MILERIENGPFFVNTYVLGCPATRKGILIDPGHEADRIQAALEHLALDIEAIVNTHGHIDHVASVKYFQDALGLPFRMHADDIPFLDHLQETCDAYGLPRIPVPTLTEPLVPGDTIVVGELSFGLRHAPGHSPGSLIFDLGDTMIVGDVVFESSIGRTDLPLGDHATLLASIRREILPRDDDVRLWPGHGPDTTVGAERRSNPFLQD